MKDCWGPTFFALFGNKKVKKKKNMHLTTSERMVESFHADVAIRLPLASTRLLSSVCTSMEYGIKLNVMKVKLRRCDAPSQ